MHRFFQLTAVIALLATSAFGQTRSIQVQRFHLTSARPFADVVATLEAHVGHPKDIGLFFREIKGAHTHAEAEKIILPVVEPFGLMEFARMDLGEVIRLGGPAGTQNSIRLLVGNPLIMEKMVRFVPDAGSYAPVTILIDQRGGVVHLSYDTMESYLASYHNAEASRVARGLDQKIQGLMKTAASRR